MLKKTITYTDYNGLSRTEDFFFNLTKAELLEWELGTEGGMQRLLEKIVAENDRVKIVNMFKEIVLKAYGVKSPDGKRFDKVIDGHRVADDFVQTEAYSDLVMELLSDPDAAAKFVNGIVPKFEQSGAPVPFRQVNE